MRISAVANVYPLVKHFPGMQVHHTKPDRQPFSSRMAYFLEGFSELRWLEHKEGGGNDQGWPQIPKKHKNESLCICSFIGLTNMYCVPGVKRAAAGSWDKRDGDTSPFPSGSWEGSIRSHVRNSCALRDNSTRDLSTRKRQLWAKVWFGKKRCLLLDLSHGLIPEAA